MRIGDVLTQVGQRFDYLYDYGDHWHHHMTVEEISEPRAGQFYPVCLGGERACPPEDCGGIVGYYDMMEVLRDPKNDEYEGFRDWLGEGFDSNLFDLTKKNVILEHFDTYISDWDEQNADLEE